MWPRKERGGRVGKKANKRTLLNDEGIHGEHHVDVLKLQYNPIAQRNTKHSAKIMPSTRLMYSHLSERALRTKEKLASVGYAIRQIECLVCRTRTSAQKMDACYTFVCLPNTICHLKGERNGCHLFSSLGQYTPSWQPLQWHLVKLLL